MHNLASRNDCIPAPPVPTARAFSFLNTGIFNGCDAGCCGSVGIFTLIIAGVAIWNCSVRRLAKAWSIRPVFNCGRSYGSKE